MITLSNTISNPRTMMIIVLHTFYPYTSIAVIAVSCLGRFFTFTERAKELCLKSLVQEQHCFFSFVFNVAWVAVAHHHKRNRADKEDEKRNYFEFNI